MRLSPVPETVAPTVIPAGNPVCDSVSCWFTLIPVGVNRTVVDTPGAIETAAGAITPFKLPAPIASGMATVSTSVPAEAVTVIFAVETTAVAAAESVRTVSVAVVLFGTNEPVTPVGRFVTLHATTAPGPSERPHRRLTFAEVAIATLPIC